MKRFAWKERFGNEKEYADWLTVEYGSGRIASDLAQEMGIGKSTLLTHLYKYGVPVRQQVKQWIEKICQGCGRTFSVKKSRVKTSRFCSRACYAIWQSENLAGENSPLWKGGRPRLICEQCGKAYNSIQRSRPGHSRFCSQGCYWTWRSIHWRGENTSGWKGGPVTLVCEICEEEFEVDRCCQGQRFCSQRCYGTWRSRNIRGENHQWWRGGVSPSPYGVGFNNKLKESIRERDNYTCVVCGTEDSRTVHHINYQKDDNRPENLTTLCSSCHSHTNTDRSMWQAFFESKRQPPVRWVPIAEYRHVRWVST